MYINRTGLRFRVIKGVNLDVKRACLEFGQWLRNNYNFPTRVVVYIKPVYRIRNNLGESVVATFFGPFDKEQEPYIKIATGDYKELLEELGQDCALASILISIAHELIHYQQWLKDVEYNEEEANILSEKIIYDYNLVKDHP